MNGILSAPPPPEIPIFKDRRTGLMVFGILEILLGCLAALMIPLMIFGQVLAAQATHEPPPLRQIVPGVFFYGAMAGVLIALGIGSFKTRRWARALSLIVAWSWLAMGVLGVAMMAFLLPNMLKTAQPPSQALPGSAMIVIMVITMLFVGILFIAVPSTLVLFYGSRHVKATCEARDLLPRWTDACPLPLLALSLWLGFGAVTLFTLPLSSNGVLPVFGRLVSGIGGWLGCGIMGALWGYSAWAVYRLRVAGWWVALISLCGMAASTWITFTRVDLLDMYRLMGYPERQIEAMQQFSFMQDNRMAYLSVAGAIPMIALLLFVKRYFRPPRQTRV